MTWPVNGIERGGLVEVGCGEVGMCWEGLLLAEEMAEIGGFEE